MEGVLRAAINPRSAATAFALLIAAFYGAGVWFAPLNMATATRSDMMVLPWISAGGVLFGSLFFRIRRPLVFLDSPGRAVVYGTTIVFLCFCVLVISTAPTLPLMLSLQGAPAEVIAASRENFLKAREGWEAALPYVHGLLTGAILPYCMSVALLRKYFFRWVIVAIFFFYSVVFVEKAFFLRVFLPLLAFFTITNYRGIRLAWLLAGAVVLLLGNIMISGFTVSTGMNAVDYFLFRTFSVPISTAADSLDFWRDSYQGIPMKGASNLVLSFLFGLPRVQFEREVFVYEWGDSETGTGSSNAAFFVEAYINFGWGGVVAFSVLTGALLSLVGRSGDQALRCLAPLLLYSLFLGGLLGVLFGNGLLACLILSAMLTRRKKTVPKGARQQMQHPP